MKICVAQGVQILRPALQLGMPSIFCLGDVHGDMASMIDTLVDNGVLDQRARWAAGGATLIQMGDMLDGEARNVPQFTGGHDVDVLRFLAELRVQARASGGDVRCLYGNHEIMNMVGIYTYVREEDMEGREEMFTPGGEAATLLADLCTPVIIKNNILFCHAGLHPDVFESVATSRAALRSALCRAPQNDLVSGDDGITMTRYYYEDEGQDYARVSAMLDRLGCDRMVIGHNCVSDHITTRCRGRVVLTDVGISRAFRTTPATCMLRIDADGCFWGTWRSPIPPSPL